MFLSKSVLCALACIGLSTASSAEQKQHQHQRKAVANGDDVTDPAKYPYFARIDFDGSQACGGSLVHREFVLSAAHCFQYPDEVVTVFADGVLEWDDYDPSKELKVVKVINHPNYDDWTGLNDIALIQVEPVPENFTTVALNSDPNATFVEGGVEVTVMGFGKQETQESADILQEVTLFITDDETCNAENSDTGGIEFESIVCALDGANNQDACTGDSGGPLVYRAPDGDIQVGLVSNGVGECGQNAASGVYSDIAFHYDWIVYTICNEGVDPAGGDATYEELCNTTTTFQVASSASTLMTQVMPGLAGFIAFFFVWW